MSAEEFLAAAHRIGRSLCRDALWSGPACNWIGWTARTIGGNVVVGKASQSAGLAYGTAGIGLFLAQLYSLTSDSLIKTTSRAALHHARQHADHADSSFFNGCLGIACALAEAGGLLDSTESDTLVCRLLEKVSRAVSECSSDGVALRYAAGVPMLLSGARSRGLKCAVDLAARIGERLAAIAVQAAGDAGASPSTAAVVASVLGELAAATGEEDFRLAGKLALRAVENDAPAAGFWPGDNPAAFPHLYDEAAATVAWLHAHAVRAAGFHPDLGGAVRHAHTVIEAACASLMRPLVPGDGGYCLGHGVAGKAEVLMLAAALLHRSDLTGLAAVAGQSGVTHFSERRMPWPCAVAGGESPNLMSGLAGIGRFYLRLYNPAAAPAFLL